MLRIAAAASAAVLLLTGCAVSRAVPSEELAAASASDTPSYAPDGDGQGHLRLEHRRASPKEPVRTTPDRDRAGGIFGTSPDPVQHPGGKVVHLTFDDGPWGDTTDEILDLLRAHGAHATFFVVGEMAADNPEQIRRIAAEGHAIGNHTWSHADLRRLDEAGIRSQLDQTRAVVEAAGARMGPCMRPPYGSTDSTVVDLVGSMGYRTVMWDVDPSDWQVPAASTLVDRLKAATRPGVTVLLHDGGGSRQHTVAAVGQMISLWLARGYRVEALPECTS
jgi:peptidoglycan/xylan/chitin deacetylase (PgdA/CDA1 family)